MALWKVLMEDKAEAELTKLLKEKFITKLDIKVLLKWISEIEEFGPESIQSSSEWHDHALDREWIGYRASSFSSSGRVIYKIVDDQIVVLVVRVTADHNYKK